ncbi:MAG: hypothetical protein ACRD7E_23745 [Bryobacteraceae bacterium]
MADQLYLSYILRGYTENNMLRHYEKMLRTFPYSRLSKGASVLRIHAVAETEPALLERAFEDPLDLDAVLAAAREAQSGDSAVMLESRWDLWQYDPDWKLTPARVMLSCFGPQFESASNQHLQIDFGIDTHFLPQPDLPKSMFMAQSNIRSLLHLVEELDRVLAVEKRRLWSDSGENFAERLKATLAG